MDTFFLVNGFVFSAFATVFLIWNFFSSTEGKEKRKKTEKFAAELRAAIIHSQPSWKEMQQMARFSEIPLPTVANLLAGMVKNVLTGEDKELEPHKMLIENYIQVHEQAEPFEGMPVQVRLHLERLSESLPNRDVLDPLTAQIRELVSIHRGVQRREQRKSLWSLIVGVVGIIIGVVFYLRPLPVPSTPTLPKNAPAMVAPK